MKKKRKVYHFVNTNIVSGLETVVANIATMVDGFDHYYVSPDGPIVDYLVQRGVQHVSIPKLTPWHVRAIISRNRPDIVQGHDVIASVCLAVNLPLCRRGRIRMISHLHNNDERMHKVGLRSILYGVASLAFDDIVVVSDPVVGEYIFKGLIKKKSITIVNVIDPAYVLEKSRMGGGDGRRWNVAFVGRMTYQKDPVKFVEAVGAMNRDRRVTAVMVGSGELEGVVRGRISELGLEGTIDMVGFQSNPYRFISASDILMMPSRYEGYPMVALESMMLGVPLVGSRVAGLGTLIDDSCGRFADDAESFARMAGEIISDKKILELLAAGARKKSATVNDIGSFVDGLKDVYRR